jgi:hypothetical protein
VLPADNRGPPELWGGGQHGAALIGGGGGAWERGTARDLSEVNSPDHPLVTWSNTAMFVRRWGKI